jgi:hypothetical protein
MQPDLSIAAAFITHLTGSSSTPMTWQVFDDDPQRRDPAVAFICHGSLPEVSYRLARANAAGCGVFVTVNATDLKGRRGRNITAVRALYIDTDGFVPSSYHLPPTMVVHSRAGIHAYWCLTDAMPLQDFRDAQRRLIKHYGSDPKIHNIDRVMRVPGFWHRKGEPFPVDLSDGGQRYTEAEVLAGLPELPKPVSRPAPPRKMSLAGIDWAGLDVVAIFQQAGFSPRDLGDGKWAIICPWVAEHSHPDWHGASTSTVIWERGPGSPATFHCSHAHCDGRRLVDALSHIGYRPSPDDVMRSRMASARALYARTLAEQGGHQ